MSTVRVRDGPPEYDPLAQLAEHLTFNQGVPRSNRGWITIFGTLEKRFNSPAFHAGIQGFESPTCHHKKLSLFNNESFFILSPSPIRPKSISGGAG